MADWPRCILAWTLLALAPVALPVHAAQVRHVHVTRDRPHYRIGMLIALQAPPRAVFLALQDFTALPHYNPDLRTVSVQPTSVANRERLFTTLHVCVLVFCKTLHQEQIMTATAKPDGGIMRAQLVPRGGDFKQGSGRWTVAACASKTPATCLEVRLDLVPAFWVPPIIGPWAIRRMMEEEATRTAAGLEQIALGFSTAPHCSLCTTRSVIPK